MMQATSNKRKREDTKRAPVFITRMELIRPEPPSKKPKKQTPIQWATVHIGDVLKDNDMLDGVDTSCDCGKVAFVVSTMDDKLAELDA